MQKIERKVLNNRETDIPLFTHKCSFEIGHLQYPLKITGVFWQRMENKCSFSYACNFVLLKNHTRNTEWADILTNWELTFTMPIVSQQEEKLASFNITLTSPSFLKDKN